MRIQIIGVEECVRLDWEGRLRLSNVRYEDERVEREKLQREIELLKSQEKQIYEAARMKNVYG